MTVYNAIKKLVRFGLSLGPDAKINVFIGDSTKEYRVNRISLTEEPDKTLMVCIAVEPSTDSHYCCRPFILASNKSD